MGKRRFALERGGPKDLRLQWRWRMRDFEVAFNDASWKLDRAALAMGATIVLPDGSSLFVQSVRRKWWPVGGRDELLVERDGIPVPGSDGDPRVIGRRAGRLILFFALLRLLLVALFLLFSGPATAGYRGASFATSVFGIDALVLAVLGILAAFGRRLPVALAAGVFALEALLMLASGAPNPVGLLVQVLLIVHLIRAWRRMAPRQRLPSLAQVFE